MDLAQATEGPPASMPELATMTPVWNDCNSRRAIHHRLHVAIKDREGAAGLARDRLVDPGDVLREAVDKHVDLGELCVGGS